MRKRVAVLAAMLVLGLSVPGAGFSGAAPLLAIQYEQNAASLVHVDPVSLERVDDSSVPLGRDAAGFVLSPDGSQAAFGSNGTTQLHLYDLRRMQARSSFEVAPGPGSALTIGWPQPNRLLALVDSCCKANAVLAVDPETGRVAGRSPLRGNVQQWAATPDGAVLLVAPTNKLGPARVVLVSVGGRLRSVTVSRVQVGVKWKGSTGRGRWAEPGFALDPVGERVFLVQARGPIAEIGLHDLSVTYHATRTLMSAQKELQGPWRYARYLGDGLIAVSGFDGVHHGSSFSFVPAGLMLIDTRDWSVRTIDATSDGFVFASSLLLVLHDESFVAYSLQGQTRFQLKIDQPLGGMVTIGSYAYVWLSDNRIDVVDLGSGKLVNTTAPKSLMPISAATSS